MTEAPQRDLIGRVLEPAVQLWLRSQVERIDTLEIAIAGRNRQILSGYIPEVALVAATATYQGLNLDRAQLTGNNIRINLGQILRGQPLRLLEPIRVSGEIHLTAANLQTSLASPLLASALNDLLVLLLRRKTDTASDVEPTAVQWQQIKLAPGALTLDGILAIAGRNASPVQLKTGLMLAGPQQLRLAPLTLVSDWFGDPPRELTLDLGTDVAFQELHLDATGLRLCGNIQIQPEPVAGEASDELA